MRAFGVWASFHHFPEMELRSPQPPTFSRSSKRGVCGARGKRLPKAALAIKAARSRHQLFDVLER